MSEQNSEYDSTSALLSSQDEVTKSSEEKTTHGLEFGLGISCSHLIELISFQILS
jgi:hypothetical protein